MHGNHVSQRKHQAITVEKCKLIIVRQFLHTSDWKHMTK